MGADALAAGTEQCAAAGRALVAAAAVRSASSSPLLPLRVVSDQATANRDSRWPHAQAESTQHTTRWSRKVGHSGVAARTRLGRERGGNLFQLAQLQTNPKHARRAQQPRTRAGSCWLDNALEESQRRSRRAVVKSGEGDTEVASPPTGWTRGGVGGRPAAV